MKTGNYWLDREKGVLPERKIWYTDCSKGTWKDVEKLFHHFEEVMRLKNSIECPSCSCLCTQKQIKRTFKTMDFRCPKCSFQWHMEQR